MRIRRKSVSEDASGESGNLHHVAINRLLPATAYYYQVEIDGSGAVREGVFVTPGAESWRFAVSAEHHASTHTAEADRWFARVGDDVAELAAIREFNRGRIALRRGDPATAGTFLERAIGTAGWRAVAWSSPSSSLP